MLASNQPYGRVDDGIGAGVISGAVIGAAGAGAFHRWGSKMGDALHTKGQERMARAAAPSILNTPRTTSAPLGGATAQLLSQQSQKPTKEALMTKGNISAGSAMGKSGQFVSDMHGKGFGGGLKGKALAYGGSILAGSIIGGTIDGLNG